MKGESPQEIHIHQTREAAARMDTVFKRLCKAVGNTSDECCLCACFAPAKQSGPASKTPHGIHPATLAAELLHAGKQRQAKNRQQDVCAPDPRKGRQRSLACEPGSNYRKKVIRGNDDDRNQRASRPSAASRLSAERYGN